MDRKDVTPKKSKGGLIGFISGLIGAAIVVALAFFALQAGVIHLPSSSSSSTSSSTANSTSKGDTKVENVTVNTTNDVTEAVEKVQGAVVSVFNLQTTSNQSIFGFGNGSGSNDNSSTETEEQIASEGSGIIYKKDGNKGYIVTNNHVVADSDSLEVSLADGTKVTAKLVGTDSYSDLAVLEIESDKITTVAEFGDSDALKLGEPAIALGSPLGSEYANSVTLGIISGIDRNISSTASDGSTTNINALQTDAAINPGNSGGPLVNIAGQVIGINSVKIAQSSSSDSVSVEGMGFAIPSNDVVEIIDQLESKGKVSRPMLGIRMTDLSLVSKEQRESILKLPDDITSGVIITSVEVATPAEKAGLEKYDVIVEMDGKEISSTTDLTSALYSKKVGDTVEVTYYRGKDKKTAKVELSLEQTQTTTQSE